MEQSTSRAHEEKSRASIYLVIGIILIIVAVVAILLFLMRGSTTVSGGYPEPESSESITCEASDIDFPVLKTADIADKTARVTATFNKDALVSIAFVYSMYYGSSNAVNGGEAVQHAAINLSSQGEGLGPDIFNLHFNKLSNRLELRLYTDASHIDLKSAKYLMLTEYPDNGIYTKSHIQTIYENQGYKCVANNQ